MIKLYFGSGEDAALVELTVEEAKRLYKHLGNEIRKTFPKDPLNPAHAALAVERGMRGESYSGELDGPR